VAELFQTFTSLGEKTLREYEAVRMVYGRIFALPGTDLLATAYLRKAKLLIC
jgi:hypothetical protein